MVQKDQKSRFKFWATRSSVRSFVRTIHSFACCALLALLARPAALTRSLVRSLAHFLARGTVNDWIANLSVPFPFSLATYQLQNETQKLDLKEKVMGTFLDKFQLTSDEVLALKGTPTPGSRLGNSNSSA